MEDLGLNSLMPLFEQRLFLFLDEQGEEMAERLLRSLFDVVSDWDAEIATQASFAEACEREELKNG